MTGSEDPFHHYCKRNPDCNGKQEADHYPDPELAGVAPYELRIIFHVLRHRASQAELGSHSHYGTLHVANGEELMSMFESTTTARIATRPSIRARAGIGAVVRPLWSTGSHWHRGNADRCLEGRPRDRPLRRLPSRGSARRQAGRCLSSRTTWRSGAGHKPRRRAGAACRSVNRWSRGP